MKVPSGEVTGYKILKIIFYHAYVDAMCTRISCLSNAHYDKWQETLKFHDM